MGKIFKSQTKLILQLDCDTDLTGQSSALIKYEKPDGTLGQFTATVTDETEGIIQYQIIDANDLDVDGQWTFWSHITFNDSKIAIGEPAQIKVYKEGIF